LEGTQSRLGAESVGLRLVYFAPADIQLARVDRICIVKFCEAIADRGGAVSLVSIRINVLESEPTATRTIWDVFGVRRPFELLSVGIPLGQKGMETPMGRALLRMARTLTYPVIAVRLMLRQRRSPGVTVLYAKNYGLVPGLLLAKRLPRERALVLFEAHVPPHGRLQSWALKSADGVVCNGHAIRQVLLERGAIAPDRSISVHQGFSQEAYPVGDRAELQRAARLKLGWSQTDKVVVYTGKVYWGYAEVDSLLHAASQLASDGIRMVLVGGRVDHAQRWRDEATRRGIMNVTFAGFVAPSEIADYQVAGDVLVSCYPSDISTKDFLSPGKLFEYMASGTPIVAAEYASLREILRHEHNALLVEPDKPDLLAQAVRRLVDDQGLAARLGDQARRDAEQYTWAARAETVAGFVASLGRK
jgi:glycosyltransferase involved in cell wall biosynthesis